MNAPTRGTDIRTDAAMLAVNQSTKDTGFTEGSAMVQRRWGKEDKDGDASLGRHALI